MRKEGIGMVLRTLMWAMLDAAMIALVAIIIRKRGKISAAERTAAVTMGIGFLISCAAICILSGNYIEFTLTLFGFMLSYASVVFSFAWE